MSEFKEADWSETSWQEASNKNDSRYDVKQEAIRNTVQRLVDIQEKPKREHEEQYLSDLTEAAGPAVRAGFEREGAQVGGGKNPAYSRGYQIWIDSLKREEN